MAEYSEMPTTNNNNNNNNDGAGGANSRKADGSSDTLSPRPPRKQHASQQRQPSPTTQGGHIDVNNRKEKQSKKTTGPPPPPKPGKINDRKISWDVNAQEEEEKEHNQQPIHPQQQHSRKLSWGGTTIEIPDAYYKVDGKRNDDDNDDDDDNGSDRSLSNSYTEKSFTHSGRGQPQSSPPAPPMDPETLFYGTDYFPPNTDATQLQQEQEERARTAAEAVQATEAALHIKSPKSQRQILQHSRFNSALSSRFLVNADDIAKAHPIECEAEAHILKAIEANENKFVDASATAGILPSMTPISPTEVNASISTVEGTTEPEAVASLFTPVTETLLGNVPEGSEGIFQKTPSVSAASTSSDVAPSGGAGEGSGSGSGSSQHHYSQRNTSYHRRGPSQETVGSLGSKTQSKRGNFITQASHHDIIPKPNYHRRQKTVEEQLLSLNQAMASVNKHSQQVLSEIPMENTTLSTSAHIAAAKANTASLFPPKTQYSSSNSNDDLYTTRPRATSLSLFNDNMARLFQDVGVNDTQVIPILEEETTPLTRESSNEKNDDSDSIVYSSSNSEEGANTKNKGGSTSELQDKENHGMDTSNVQSDAPSENTISSSRKESSFIRADKKGTNDIEMGFSTRSPEHGDDAGPGIERSDSYGRRSLVARKRKRSVCFRFFQKLGLIQNIDDFLKPRRPSIWKFIRALLWLFIVAIAVAVVLFYIAGNPPTGIVDLKASAALNGTYYVTTSGSRIDPDAQAAHSWWILYACVRLPITFALARFFETLFIDFLILERRWVVSCMGPTLTLLVVQSKGWPSILFFWSLCNLGLLVGTSPFVAHWGYWQDYVDLFNEANPSGGVTSSVVNLKVQLIALASSMVVAVKRLLIGFYQGRKTFLNYAEDLTNVMTRVLLISEVANLAIRLEKETQDKLDNDDDGDDGSFHLSKRASTAGIDDATKKLNEDLENEEDNHGDNDAETSSHNSYSLKTFPSHPSMTGTTKKLLIAEQDKEYVTGRLTQAQKRRIERLLGNWEEPENETVLTDSVSIGAILQFRTSLSKLDSHFPFSYAFGRADGRDRCIQSSQDLYLRLLQHSYDSTLHFNILGLVALQRDGTLDQEKLKSLIKVFRPGRNGRLSLVDFVKSVDVVYKEMKLLRASVRSSQKIDQSFERIFNFLFYAVIFTIILAILGLDPLALFLSLSSFLLAFSFMISRASSNYFEGLLFILCRRPYDIGDRIVIQPVDAGTSWDGATDWIVRDIDLFTTTVIYAYTNEIATLSNGSIANSRVMNGARSLPAILYVTLRFGIDVTYDQLEIFREALYQYVEARPREWAKLWAVRVLSVQADEGFIEYLIILEHVENWQNLDSLLHSRGLIRGFCHELAKQLDMRYISPALPVDLNIRNNGGIGTLIRGATNDGGGDGAVGAAFNNNNVSDRQSIATMSAESEAIRSIINDRKR